MPDQLSAATGGLFIYPGSLLVLLTGRLLSLASNNASLKEGVTSYYQPVGPSLVGKGFALDVTTY